MLYMEPMKGLISMKGGDDEKMGISSHKPEFVS